jgi:hypothetical protein
MIQAGPYQQTEQKAIMIPGSSKPRAFVAQLSESTMIFLGIITLSAIASPLARITYNRMIIVSFKLIVTPGPARQ